MTPKTSDVLVFAALIAVLAALASVLVTGVLRPAPATTSSPVLQNPSTVTFDRDEDYDRITRWEMDTVDATGAVVQTIVLPKAVVTATDTTVSAPIRLYPLEPGVYTNRLRAVVAAPGVSPNHTRVPPALAIIDLGRHVWTIGAESRIYRDGTDSGGIGSELLWSGGSVYTLGTDANWYVYQGAGWALVGFSDPSGGAPANPARADGEYTASGDSALSNPWVRGPVAVF
jgi:hypothetical protein